jgi:hypothetical protein
MRSIALVLLLFPTIANSQFKRSATELGKENIKEYVIQKLFKGLPYQAVSYGELTDSKTNDRNATCFIKHKFKVTEMQHQVDNKVPIQKEYTFVFYFDDKMKVYKAENIFTQ